MQISIETNIADTIRELTALQRRQVPFATFLTVNKLAENSKKSFEINEIPKLDRPTRYTHTMMFAEYAKKGVLSEARAGGNPNITSNVRVKDRGLLAKRGGNTPRDVMQHLFESGERRGKGVEGYFIRAGYMLRGQFAVPASGAPMDQNGNVDRRFIVQLLSYLRLFNESGFRANVKDRGAFSKRFASRNKTTRQADIIVNFVRQIHEHENEINLIIHCFAGVSRSAGVGKFVNDIFKLNLHPLS